MLRISDKEVATWTKLLAVSTGALVMVTIIAAIIGFIQLHELSTTSNGEFIMKFRNNFYSSYTGLLEELIARNLIVFDTTCDMDYFKFNKDKIDSLKSDSLEYIKFTKLLKTEHIDSIENYMWSSNFIDNNIIGHFEEMGYYEKKGLIKIDFVYEFFSDDIITCWESPEIQKYLKRVRNEYGENGADVYGNFEYIYNKVVAYEKEKLNLK